MAETVDTILERMLAEIPERYDVSVGTYTNDIERSAATEFENAYDIIDTLDGYFYATTATGTYLDKRVREFGLTRKSASAASGNVTITGTSGAKITSGIKVAAGNVFFSVVENTEIPTSGSISVSVVCDAAGSAGNVSAGAINRFPVTITGLISVTNAEDTSGGSDTETDAELRARFTEYVSHPTTSGNKWQYIAWAKSVDGVGDAKCIPLWNGNGTVKVIIVDSEKQLAGDTLIDAVKTKIESERPIGASVTVATASPISITVKCRLTSSEDVSEDVKENISAYLRDVSFSSGYVSYAKIGNAILETPGVTDYEDLTVNDGTSNIAVGDTEIAVLGGADFDG